MRFYLSQRATAIRMDPWMTEYATREPILSVATNLDAVIAKQILRDAVAIAARMAFGISILTILRDVKVRK